MHPELLLFLDQFPDLSLEDKAAMARQITVVEAAKGTILIEEGVISQDCYFVLKGCLRQYRLVDGLEQSTTFYTEGQAAVLFTSYTLQTPTDHFLSCLEDSVFLIGNPVKDAALYAQFPQLEQITRRMMAEDFGKTQDHHARFMHASAAERYLQLLQDRPDLLQRVPQHQLASYLGITPESLSRIRKRIQKTK
ncbi:cyclic nucleotide-binding protein [Taibaiella sp. KBW10]|uniref:Crp/Fnr family transcriptional regulator n=1 Tax=Taibaiella sp. KBW10 TaxID=2153357 RepID=UPI000F594B7F|nr:Crp/Fnr family transcriptional regulator [Taibaiella sp. KBW10]RQO32362.1 cyclic nucleotide-binding protein [Taibaiella sp. KBW10]